MSGSPKVVLWISRHRPLTTQVKTLEEKLGSIKLIEYAKPVPTAEKVIEIVEQTNASYVIPVLPMSFVIRLVQESKKIGFKVLRAEMELIHHCTTKPCPDYNPNTDSIVESKDFETGNIIYRHYRFKGFKVLKEVKFVEEEF